MSLLKIKFRPSRLEAIIFILRVLVGGLFIVSGLSKLILPREYMELVINLYDLPIPRNLVPFFSRAFPWLEFISGSFLLLGYWSEGAVGVLTLLTCIFQVILAQAIIRKLPINACGCFGGEGLHLTLPQSFALDTILVATLVWIGSQEKWALSLDNWFQEGDQIPR